MLPELVAFWLSRMPLQTDKGESRVAIRQLCARIESNCPATLQANNLAVVRDTLPPPPLPLLPPARYHECPATRDLQVTVRVFAMLPCPPGAERVR